MQLAFQIKLELVKALNYVKLTSSLLPPDSNAGIFNPIVRLAYDEASRFLSIADSDQLIQHGPQVLNAIEPILKLAIANFPPKKDLLEIFSEFKKLNEENPELLSYGIPFWWLDKHIDISYTLDPNIPYHARIGIGYHASKWSVEEYILLSDSFFLLVKAEEELAFLLSFGEERRRSAENGYPSEDVYHKTRILNSNACSYSRNSLINMYSFIECFVNSLGFDYYLRNKTSLSDQDQDILQGRKKNSFISLEYKIEKFHQIIRLDKKQVIWTLDPKQVKDPFATFFDEYKEVRDASMHYSPNKKAIWRRPNEWVDKAKRCSEIGLRVAQVFWNSCYPERNFPDYLFDLDYESCYIEARERLIETIKTQKLDR